MLALTVFVSLFSCISAQVAVASPMALALVDAQYANSGFPSHSNTGFGASLKSLAILQVNYTFGIVQNGIAYGADQVNTPPSIAIIPADPGAFSGKSYTIMLADAGSLGDPDGKGNYRHYLENGAKSPSNANATRFSLSDGIIITSYSGPGPVAGSGPHRYAWLLFNEPANFVAPAGLATAGVPSDHWNVSSYVETTGLVLVAASFFTVENNAPTGPVGTTMAVDTATLVVPTATPTPASITTAAKSTTATSATSAAKATTTTSKAAGNAAPTLAASLPRLLAALSMSIGAIVLLC